MVTAFTFMLLFWGNDNLLTQFKPVVEYEAKQVLVPISVDVDGKGRLLAVDNVAHTVHVWRADGSYLTRFGRKGKGPGEFTFQFTPRILALPEQEKILVTDKMMINEFDGETFEFIKAVELPYRWIDKLERLTADTFLMDVVYWDSKYVQYRSELIITDADYNRIKTISMIENAFKKRRAKNTYDIRPWGPRFCVLMKADHFIVARSDEPKLNFYDSSGEQLRSMRLPLPHDIITDEEIDEMRMLYYRDLDPHEKVITEEYRYVNRMVSLGDDKILAATYRHGRGLMKGKVVDLDTGQALAPFQHFLGEQGSINNASGKLILLLCDEAGDWRILEVEPNLEALITPTR